MSVKEALYIGFEVAETTIRAVASDGRRISVARHSQDTPEEWLEMCLYGFGVSSLVGVSSLICLGIATPVAMKAVNRGAIISAVSTRFYCTPYALARGVGWQDSAVAVVVEREAISVAVIRGCPPSHLEIDTIHPAPTREAREIAVSVRCLLKAYPRGIARGLLGHVCVAGDEAEIDRIGKHAIAKELSAMGATIRFPGDSHVIAAGAERLAYEHDFPPVKEAVVSE